MTEEELNQKLMSGLVVVEGALGIDWSSCQASRSTTIGVSVAQELSPTLIAQGANVAFMHERVRRLTPLECARLQGFPDSWTEHVCTGVSDSELQFWRPLWDRWCEVRRVKMKTDKQLKTWLATPPSDTALYKLWGNGIALPCAAFVLGALRPYLERDAHKSC